MKEGSRRIAEWREDPLPFVRDMFGAKPDAWQADALTDLGNPGRKRGAMEACAGPAKTAVLTWTGWHRPACFAAPYEHPKGIAVSITGDNLRRNQRAEMARWRNGSPFLQRAFEWTSGRIFARDHPETWFLTATSWPKTDDLETIDRRDSRGQPRLLFTAAIDEVKPTTPRLTVARAIEMPIAGNCLCY
jgi:hypothetical protein